MGPPANAVACIEMEDYLVLENASRYKHEYLDGVIYAIQGEPVRGMAGGSAIHADLIRNVGFALHQRPLGSRLELPGLGVALDWDEVYAGVGLG